MFTTNNIVILTLIDVIMFFASFFLIELSGLFSLVTIITFMGAIILPTLKTKKE